MMCCLFMSWRLAEIVEGVGKHDPGSGKRRRCQPHRGDTARSNVFVVLKCIFYLRSSISDDRITNCGAAVAHRRPRWNSGENPFTQEMDGLAREPILDCGLRIADCGLRMKDKDVSRSHSAIHNSKFKISSPSLRADPHEEPAVDRFVGDGDRDGLHAVGIDSTAAIIGPGGRLPS